MSVDKYTRREGAKIAKVTRREEPVMDVFDFRERAGSGVDERTEDLATAVIGAAIEVHRILKPGLPESVYRKALAHELTLRGISHQQEYPVPVLYKGEAVGEGRVDILVEERLVVEWKAVEALNAVHQAQVIGYLQALDLQLGLLINFNVAVLRQGLKRIVNTHRH